MKNILQSLILTLSFSLVAPYCLAIDSQTLPDVKPGIVSMTTKDPDKRVGYSMGDIVEREVVLTIQAPYKLIETSLPIVGYEKRYRGKLIGVNLQAIEHTKQAQKDYTTHKIKLSYQIFVSTVVAKNIALGPEYIHLINTQNKKDIVKYRIPILNVSTSPLAIFGQVKVENNMSPFLPPPLLSAEKEYRWLKVASGIFVLSLLALIYILGQRAWLPRMGGRFATTFSAIKKLPDNDDGIKQAISKSHLAFNQTAGFAIFNDNLNDFLRQHPNFMPLKTEIEQFFGLSRQVYFEPGATHGVGNATMPWLLNFVRRCRDCERGLLPSPLKAKV
ncbi:MAG: hypothetical protein PHD12_04495 [Methylotenera sp.]|nr:hypothetical protein [Methylotenera sp.]